VSADQLIAEFKALPPEQRQRVAEAILEDESWIPESFRQGMKDIEAGRTVPLETALTEPPPQAEA
jgi:predicted transcriptional regulator